MRILLSILCMAMLLPTSALSRPVSYPGGITVMQLNDVDTNSIHIHHSPTAKYSIGYKGEYGRDEKWQFHGLQLNYLVKRWNKPLSQANVYMKSGFGIAQTNKHDNDLAAFSGVSLDWENRRLFIFYENRLYEREDINGSFTQKARLGVAPYLGNYGDLHTWIMLQIDHTPEKDDTITVTPVLRLFKSYYLTELGVSEDGDALLNFVVRF